LDKVTIVIPFYNCPYIDRAIQSALNQTYSNIEVIVVNDGSTKYAKKITPYRHLIRYIEKGNGGTATALNLGIKNASGDYFTWLSSDDLYDSRKVEMQLTFMKTNKASVSFTNYYLMNEKGQMTDGPFKFRFPNVRQFYRSMLQSNFINGCTVIVKMNVFDDLGLFDETLRYAHDYDLWLRILKKYEFYYLNEPLVKYRIHDKMGTKRFSDVIWKEVVYVRQKHRKALMNLIRNRI
jgi:glycosyltransferase involved in cell wall biosynthesis